MAYRMELVAVGFAMLSAVGAVIAADAKPKGHPIYGQSMESLAGQKLDLSKFEGKVLLIVNVASKCGYTHQYEPLEAAYEKYQDKGFVVLGVPSNQFGGQEPGSAADIAAFCEKNYGVKFPMLAKVDVKGGDAVPLYRYLTSEEAGSGDAGPVKWNFEKFLVSRDGKVAGRFRSSVEPDSAEMTQAIERELAKPATK